MDGELGQTVQSRQKDLPAEFNRVGSGRPTKPSDDSRGLRPVTVQWLLRLMTLVSLPACIPLICAVAFAGVICIASAWWRVLPAVLPGDEVFNAERVVALTLRTVIGWAQPPDAPGRPALSNYGIGLLVASAALLAIGVLARASRRRVSAMLARLAGEMRLVVPSVDANAFVPGEDLLTTAWLGDRNAAIQPGSLHLPLDAAFFVDTLPRCAAQTRELFALGIDAGANLDLARRLIKHRQRGGAHRRLDRLVLRIDSRELRSSIGREGCSEFWAAAADVRLTSLPEARCRSLLRHQPPSKIRLFRRDASAAIVVIGLGETGLELLTKLCAQAQSSAHDPLLLVLVDTEAPAIVGELRALWPALDLVATLSALALESRLPQSAVALGRHLATERLVATSIYIALDDVPLAAAWQREVALAVRLNGQNSPLIVNVAQATRANVTPPADEERLEVLLRYLHSSYLKGQQQDPSVSLPDWARLPFDMQEDNRSAADHLWTQAHDLESEIAVGDGPVPPLAFALQLETLAAAEHRRWLASRATNGWRFGDVVSQSDRMHPCIRPWLDLSDAERDKDREAVKRMAEILGAAGFRVLPLISFSLPRRCTMNDQLEQSIDAANAQARAAGGKLRLVMAVEDGRSFRLAQRLSELPDVALSLVLAQPLIGLAVAAEQSEDAAAHVTERAQTVWLTHAESIDELLNKWPTFNGECA